MKKRITIFLYSLLLLTAAAAAQNNAVLMPIPQQQFFLPTGGGPCSGCFIFSFVSGTHTLQNTYTDSTKNTANTNPIVLNANGYAQTSIGTQVGIWLDPTLTYRIVLQNAAHVQLWLVDGITGQFTGTITNPLQIQSGVCNQISVGLTNFQTSLCFPAPASNIVLTFPNAASDNVVTRGSTDTMSNKTLTSPLINTPTVNSCGPMPNGPGTYSCIANAGAPGTTLGGLVKLTGVPSTVVGTTTADVGGIMGVCVSGCGTTGTAVIQQSGLGFCNFDGVAVSGDYFQNSPTVATDCHDASSGASMPGIGQILGRVLANSGSPGSVAVDWYGPELIPPFPVMVQNGTVQQQPQKLVVFSGNLAGGTATYNFVNNAIFVSLPTCIAVDRTAANPVAVTTVTTSSVTVIGTTTDNINGYCIGH